MKPFTLKPEQAEAVRRIANEPTRAALAAAGTGFGKTLIAVEVAKEIGAKQVLALVPVKTKKAWADTAKRQGFESVKDITSSKKGLANADDLFAGVPGFYTIGREFFALSATRNVNKEGEVTREPRWHYRKLKHLDLIVLDESHGAQNRQSTLASALRQVPKDVFKIAMSATPAGNRFDGFWFPCQWLWPKHVINPETGKPYVDHRYHHWVVQWANVITRHIHVNGRVKEVTDQIVEKVPGAFVNSLPCYVYYEAPKVPVHTRVVSVPLTEKQAEQYRQMEEHYLVWLEDQIVTADLTIVQKTRLRQIGLGEITFLPPKKEGDEPEIGFDIDCKSAKADAIVKLSTEHHPNEQMVIYTSSRKFAEVLVKRIPYSGLWAGTVSHKAREKLKEDFINGKVKNIVATIPSVAEGLDGLQLASNIEVWTDKSFNGVLNQQCSGRLNRTGQVKDHIISYELVSPFTDDEKHLKKLVEQQVAMRKSMKT